MELQEEHLVRYSRDWRLARLVEAGWAVEVALYCPLRNSWQGNSPVEHRPAGKTKHQWDPVTNA